jgi:GNAT superfamily N-acetyltransferase
MTPQLVAETSFLAQFFPPRGASRSFAAHAAREGGEYDVYREMYAALADEFVRRGFFEHMVSLPAQDAAAIEAFVSLGFGTTSACAVRGVEPVERAGASIEVHQASAEDFGVIASLRDELTLHHARPPIFSPWLTEADQAAYSLIQGLLQDPEANAHWVGYRDGKPVGMTTFMPPSFLAPMELPDSTIYLFLGVVTEEARLGGIGSAILARGVDWARENGYAHIALHFATPNVSGAKFWQDNGFVPVEYGMRRTIDPRIAWARG